MSIITVDLPICSNVARRLIFKPILTKVAYFKSRWLIFVESSKPLWKVAYLAYFWNFVAYFFQNFQATFESGLFGLFSQKSGLFWPFSKTKIQNFLGSVRLHDSYVHSSVRSCIGSESYIQSSLSSTFFRLMLSVLGNSQKGS